MKKNEIGQPVAVAVLVSGGGTNLQALLDAQAAGILSHGKITLVVSDHPGVYALTRAENAGVPAVTVDKHAFETPAAWEKALADVLKQAGIELILLAGFTSILSKRFVNRYQKRILNVHPSLIPAFCGKGYYGLKVHEAALARGVKVTGATVHFVNEIPDGGEIILQKAVEVRKSDTPQRLQRRVMEQAEWKILPAAAETVCRALVREKQKRDWEIQRETALAKKAAKAAKRARRTQK